jgi:DNA-binding NtrC family response regulator
LPENLLESELFGYEKGAFTGAFQRKFGKFEIAGSGTIFLDEIGNLTFNLQQKLLRVLQSRQFERVGGNETLNVNARFIAAANVDLEKEVNDGNFRKDLFYRLNVASIYLPSLSEKREDIPLLVEFFLAKSNYFLKKKVKGLSKEAIEFLKNYDYPGNIRELENIIERGVMLTKGDLILPNALPVMKKKVEKINEMIKTNNNFKQARSSILSNFEKEFLIKSLVKFKGNISLAAVTTGMTRQNFQRLLRKYNITADKFRKKDF